MINHRDYREGQTPGIHPDYSGNGWFSPHHFDGATGSMGFGAWRPPVFSVPIYPQVYPFEAYPPTGLPGYPPYNPYDYGFQQPFSQPLYEQPEVSIEINVMVTEKNVAELSEKIPFLRVLIQQGVIRMHPDLVLTDPNRTALIAHLERRAEPSTGNRPLENPIGSKRVSQTPNASLEPAKPNLPMTEYQFTTLKQEIEHILTEELKKSERDNVGSSHSFRKGEASIRSDSAPLSTPKDSIPARSIPQRLNLNVTEDRSPVGVSSMQAPLPQFSFQRMEAAAYDQRYHNSDFKSYVDRMRRMEPTNSPTEFDKIGLFQCKNIRNFWGNSLDPRPYVFKSKRSVKQPNSDGRTVLEILDYSNKRIADAEYRISEEGEAIESEGDGSHSVSNSVEV
jgi:hypothetical protein